MATDTNSVQRSRKPRRTAILESALKAIRGGEAEDLLANHGLATSTLRLEFYEAAKAGHYIGRLTGFRLGAKDFGLEARKTEVMHHLDQSEQDGNITVGTLARQLVPLFHLNSLRSTDRITLHGAVVRGFLAAVGHPRYPVDPEKLHGAKKASRFRIITSQQEDGMVSMRFMIHLPDGEKHKSNPKGNKGWAAWILELIFEQGSVEKLSPIEQNELRQALLRGKIDSIMERHAGIMSDRLMERQLLEAFDDPLFDEDILDDEQSTTDEEVRQLRQPISKQEIVGLTNSKGMYDVRLDGECRRHQTDVQDRAAGAQTQSDELEFMRPRLALPRAPNPEKGTAADTHKTVQEESPSLPTRIEPMFTPMKRKAMKPEQPVAKRMKRAIGNMSGVGSLKLVKAAPVRSDLLSTPLVTPPPSITSNTSPGGEGDAPFTPAVHMPKATPFSSLASTQQSVTVDLTGDGDDVEMAMPSKDTNTAIPSMVIDLTQDDIQLAEMASSKQATTQSNEPSNPPATSETAKAPSKDIGLWWRACAKERYKSWKNTTARDLFEWLQRYAPSYLTDGPTLNGRYNKTKLQKIVTLWLNDYPATECKIESKIESKIADLSEIKTAPDLKTMTDFASVDFMGISNTRLRAYLISTGSIEIHSNKREDLIKKCKEVLGISEQVQGQSISQETVDACVFNFHLLKFRKAWREEGDRSGYMDPVWEGFSKDDFMTFLRMCPKQYLDGLHNPKRLDLQQRLIRYMRDHPKTGDPQ